MLPIGHFQISFKVVWFSHIWALSWVISVCAGRGGGGMGVEHITCFVRYVLGSLGGIFEVVSDIRGGG